MSRSKAQAPATLADLDPGDEATIDYKAFGLIEDKTIRCAWHTPPDRPETTAVRLRIEEDGELDWTSPRSFPSSMPVRDVRRLADIRAAAADATAVTDPLSRGLVDAPLFDVGGEG